LFFIEEEEQNSIIVFQSSQGSNKIHEAALIAHIKKSVEKMTRAAQLQLLKKPHR
jgi:hypothetical protein